MADALLQLLFENINSLLQKEFDLVWGIDREMQRLSNILITIRDVLEDAEGKQFKEKAIKSWLKKLKDAAYDAEDILDECAAKELQSEAQMRNCNNCNYQVSHSFSSWFNFEQLMFRRKIGQRIKDIRERFDDIAAERSNFHLNRGIVEWSNVESNERETSSILTEPQVYGRDEDKEKIVKVLLDNISNPNLLVFPIIGMGGLGKTTLAQLVYNDERVKNHFEARYWVCVYDDFDIKRLTKAIIESMGGTAGDIVGLDPLQSHLHEMLGKRRFLLVLDDVWNEDRDKWDRLKYSLRGGVEGSSILVTTRLPNVASIVGTCPAYQLQVLSEDDCWALFKHRAFGDSSREEKENMVVIGKEIVKKCGGVPLAVKALGSLLLSKHTEDQWKFVRDSEIWDLPKMEENTILPALRLSYNHLPSHLRQCFAYCSIFPKDYEMEKEQLVHLWMANGFIPSKGRMELEDVGNEIFNELLLRSFFQDVQKDDYGNVEFCKMHDLVHDLACSVMDNECLTLETNKEKIVQKGIRHLFLKVESPASSHLKVFFPSINDSLRTLLLKMSHYPQPPMFNFSNLRHLRVLDLSYQYFYIIPSSIASLIHLRYLNLTGNDLKTLPESLCNLKHLQTLILCNCDSLERLPAQMSTMSSLRHLDILGCSSLNHMPIGIGRLIHLQTLSFFIVGKKSGYGINELQGLNLGGSLEIRDLQNVKNSTDSKQVNLIRKRNLDSLTLSWSSWSPNIETHVHEKNIEEVLQGLHPPPSIKELTILNYKGMKSPSWMEDLSLQNLVKIKLRNCSIRYLSGEFYSTSDGLGRGFPSLKYLELEGMPNLEELLLNVPKGREAFPCLVSMTIANCDKLTTLPLLPSLQRLHLETENENIPEGLLQIHNLPLLQRLEFYQCSKLIELPRISVRLGELRFSSLEVLVINGCHAMKSLWEDEIQFQELSSLKRLKIVTCNRLASLSGMRYLTALERLNISNCREMGLTQSEDFQYLTSLQKLVISDLPKLMSLPESLKHTIMLQHLEISWCKGLTVLPEWIHNLTSLRTLEIHSCNYITFLPDSLRQLITLQTLIIQGCPVLETRYREGAQDWNKIAHIPNVIF